MEFILRICEDKGRHPRSCDHTADVRHLRVACMAISLVGDRFTEREEQTVLLHMLTKTRDKFGWSTSFTYVRALKNDAIC